MAKRPRPIDIEDTCTEQQDGAGRMRQVMKQFELIKKMRKGMIAPVDVIGCDKLAEGQFGSKTWRFQTLVALMLSSQTKDEVTAAAMHRLQAKGLSPDSLRGWLEADLADVLKPVGFYRIKAKSLKRTAEILGRQYDDDIPDTLDALVSLPGVGPKMAFLALQCAWGRSEGIGVDVHVHRISARLAWTHGCKTPEDTRKQLEALFPRDLWREINHLLVGFGQMHCLPRNPKCLECAVLPCCPYGRQCTSSEGP